MHRRRTTALTSLTTAVVLTGAMLVPSAASAATYKASKQYRGNKVTLTVTTRDDGTARLRTTNNLPLKCDGGLRIKFKMDFVVKLEGDGSFSAKNRENVDTGPTGKGTASERYTGAITPETAKLRFRTKVNGAKRDCSAEVNWTATPQ